MAFVFAESKFSNPQVKPLTSSTEPANRPGQDSRGNPLARLWEAWKRVGKKIGNFQARVLLGVFYFLLLFPFALLLKLFSDPLTLKSSAAPHWLPREPTPETHLERAGREF